MSKAEKELQESQKLKEVINRYFKYLSALFTFWFNISGAFSCEEGVGDRAEQEQDVGKQSCSVESGIVSQSRGLEQRAKDSRQSRQRTSTK